MEHSINLNHVKSTKNTEVFGTQDDNAVVSQLYIKKSAFVGETPKAITVHIVTVIK